MLTDYGMFCTNFSDLKDQNDGILKIKIVVLKIKIVCYRYTAHQKENDLLDTYKYRYCNYLACSNSL